MVNPQAFAFDQKKKTIQINSLFSVCASCLLFTTLLGSAAVWSGAAAAASSQVKKISSVKRTHCGPGVIGISFNQHTNARTHTKSLLEIWYPKKWLFKIHLPFNTRRKAKVISFFSCSFYLSFILIDGPIIIVSKWKGTVFIFRFYFYLCCWFIFNFLLLFSTMKAFFYTRFTHS